LHTQHAVIPAKAGIQERRGRIASFFGVEASGLPHGWPLAAVPGGTMNMNLGDIVRLLV